MPTGSLADAEANEFFFAGGLLGGELLGGELMGGELADNFFAGKVFAGVGPTTFDRGAAVESANGCRIGRGGGGSTVGSIDCNECGTKTTN